MFDNICKFLAETYSTDMASWLLGEPIPLTQVQPQELAVEPIRADSLILLETEGLLLHLEFQTKVDPQIPFRMLDYWVRGKRRFPDKKIRQFVIYLKETSSDVVFQQEFQDDSTYHRFEVIRLWEQPVTKFLEFTGMLPFAILVNEGDKEQLLQDIAQKIDEIPEQKTRQIVGAATYVLAGLVLDKNIIKQILRRDIMRESVTYQEILEEGRLEGEVKGRKEGEVKGRKEGEIKGRKQGLLTIILRLLTRKFGNLPPKMHTRIARLQIPRLESLAEAILDFESVADLELWLNKKK
ncbi:MULTISPECIES: Rpn family recombination-promoting nuclease/putative transposase [Pseudanabaena]|uniref:Rpn family recombination-promoting nuclease/putative transposase n=1 Tax=Pseudanabaena TaxID=1152 RepID=UPI00247A7E48|nr:MULTISPECIES: Rpn family recombination-promoting nuclease/putative transposase [Pseudanabaena]MEA5490310.1 Rpn family recombination-promoting nuclease/putative transposase [Pseudanabaena sp. CCNP1317]WGS73756.1 Rpn family recombination-promoting nuclease/putative transposase [Pseudanabaena galeata CCNP1313]